MKSKRDNVHMDLWNQLARVCSEHYDLMTGGVNYDMRDFNALRMARSIMAYIRRNFHEIHYSER